ncbi:histidine kinase dimerization/phosphoacceptor domain -containing protein [Costertonia aggregata]|uniref:histidine kinase n=1 Tax=Costertonia aggregata TaxID=343403 RepID=A0A7H9AUS8_9FLAO|nr:histidine kinase dimerization/phosphoacceptor domain -containing protein [Costertonia aggregata]QLG47157.1 histidine kinase [Costertonia aggregata]
MKSFFNLFITIVFTTLLSTVHVVAQDTLDLDTIVDDKNYLKEFKDTQKSENRVAYFFCAQNRYNENSAYDWLDEVNIYLNNSLKSSDSSGIRNYKLIQSQIEYDLGNYYKSISLAEELYKKIEDFDKSKMGFLLDIMDKTYSKLRLSDKQVAIREEKRRLGLIDKVVFYDIYSDLGMHRKAMNDYILEESKNSEEHGFYATAEYQNNVGKYLLLDNSYTTALTKFKEAKGYIVVFLNDITNVKTEAEILQANILNGVIDGNIGKCQVKLKEFDLAIPNLESSIETISEYNTGKYSDDIIENTLALADCYLQKGDLKKAKEYLDTELNLVDIAHIFKRNRLFSVYHDKTGNYRTANTYLKQNSKIQDSINSSEVKIKTQQLQAVAEQEVAISKQMIAEQRLDLEKSRSAMLEKEEQISLVFISLIFTLLGFAGLVYAYLKSIKSQRLIAEQKHFIENSLVEKDSLLKEIHHRVKNNLQMVSSLLSLQTKNTRSKAAIEALEEGKSRVKAMALIHQKLYQNDDLSVIEMQGYIESLVNSVQSVFKKGGHNINITIDAEGVELDIDRAIPFGLILNELVSNSFKYAFPDDKDDNGKIYIHLRKNAEQGFFEYTDNGIGLPEDTDERTQSSMGIRLMNRLVNQLQSVLNIDKTANGVRFWFNFK